MTLIADVEQLADKHAMLELRTIRAGDLLNATRICIRAKAHWGYPKAFVAACVPGLTLTENDLATSRVMGAFDVQRLVGVVQIAFDGGDCLLDKLFVDPDWIGNGVGRELFDWCRETACAHGAARMVIESDPFAEPIYLAMGCRRVGYVRSDLTHREIPLLEFALAETITLSNGR